MRGFFRSAQNDTVQNYFNYFTEIEERFQQRRGSLLMLSTLDWALIETWREAGVPLEGVLRGIDVAFDKYDARAAKMKGRARRVNGLAWCAQSVIEAVEAMQDAAVGASSANAGGGGQEARESGFEAERVERYLEGNAMAYEGSGAGLRAPADGVAAEIVERLRGLAADLRRATGMSLEELDRTLTVLEEKMFAAVLTSTGEAELVDLKGAAARELAPYRGKMGAVQIRQVERQFLQKRLMEARGLPRLSLFYMSHG